VTVLHAAAARVEVADFVGAAFSIYALVLIAWIVASLLFSLGVSPPYSRVGTGVLDFLRDTAEPYLRIFRRLGLQFGPFDFSPIIAIIVLQVVGALTVGAIDPG
jgi:YggT family protein